MIGGSLALIVVLGQAPSSASEAAGLVVRLGAARYAEREAAAAALERLGSRALPALRLARDQRDPEIRTRAANLIAKIEGSLLTQPTRIMLNFEDKPLGDVLRSVSEQSGIRVVLYPEQGPAALARTITLRESAPLPFWQAIDRVCDAAQLQYNLGGIHMLPDQREPVFPLFAGGPRPSGPAFDSGPFRVSLVRAHYESDILFGNAAPTAFPRGLVQGGLISTPSPRGAHTLNEQFYAQVQIAAEPRLSLSQHGYLKVLEAVDDLGQSLVIPSQSSAISNRFSAYAGMSVGSMLQLQIPLHRPEHPGKTIRKLRGVLPVLVSTRKPNPLVVPINGSVGRLFRNNEVTLTLEEVRVNPNTHQTSIELAVRTNANPTGATGGPVAPASEFLVQGTEPTQQQIEVVDAQGRTIPWYHADGAEGSRVTLTLTPHDQGPPSAIRYFSVARATTEVRFEFVDIPIPGTKATSDGPM